MKKKLTSNLIKSLLALSLLFNISCSNEGIEDSENVVVETATTEFDESQVSKPWDNDVEVPKAGKTYYIANVNSGRFLDVEDESKKNGANVYQWDYHGGENQQWKVIETSDKKGMILQSVNSGKCLDVANMSENMGGNVHQWGYWGGENQKWKITHLETKECFLMNMNSGHYLEVTAAKTGKTANVQQWGKNTGQHQRWWFIPI